MAGGTALLALLVAGGMVWWTRSSPAGEPLA